VIVMAEENVEFSAPRNARPKPPILTPEQVEFIEQFPHLCKDCKWLKPIIPGTVFPPADLVGYCKIIHWPFYWCVSKYTIVKKCRWFEKRGENQYPKH